MAERDLIIKVKYDATQADADADAFWQRERQRQQQGAIGMGAAIGGGAGPLGAGAAPLAVAAMGGPGPSAALTASGAPDLGALRAQADAAARARAGIIAAGAGAPAGSPLAAAGMSAQQNLAAMQADVQRAELAAMNRGAAAAAVGSSNAMAAGLAGWPQGPAMLRRATPGALAVGAVAAGAGSELIHDAWRSSAEAHQHIWTVVDEAAAARTAQRETAALRGLPSTAATAAMMAREASGAGVGPGEWDAFQRSFLAFGGQYVGEGRRYDQARAAALQQQFARYAVGARGLSSADSARLLATVMARARPGSSDEDIIGQAGQLTEVMQLAPGYTGPLLGQLSEVIGEATGPGGELADPLAAAVMLRGEAERNPRTASAYTRAVLRGLRRARMDPAKARELGLAPGMDTFEQLQAVQRAADAARARGEDEGEFLDRAGFREVRQYGGIRAALDYGLRGGAYERARAEAGDRGAMAARVGGAARDYLSGEEGSAMADAAALAAARHDRAAGYQELARFRRRAEIAVESSGELERGEGLMAIATYSGYPWYGDRREQLVRAETTRNVQMALENSARGRAYLAGGVAGPNTQLRRDYLESHRRDSEDRILAEMLVELRAIRADAQREARRKEARAAAEAQAALGVGAGALGLAAVVQMPGAMDGR